MVGVTVTLLLSLVGGALAVRFGPDLGFVDRPDGGLKPHARAAVPLGGGAIFLGVHAGMAADQTFDPGLFLATAIVLVLGLIDDRRGLSPRFRLAVELIAAVTLVGLAELRGLPPGALGVVIGIVMVMVTINAVNLFDGLDGLVGLSGLVTAIGIAVLAGVRALDSGFGILLAVALLGFLAWNWYPARLFLGDNGAYTVAVFLTYGFLGATPPAAEALSVVAFALLGVFALDLVVTLLRRRLAGHPLFEGDRSHIYDQLRDRAMSVPEVAVVMAGAQAVLVTVVIVTDVVFSAPMSVLVLAAVLALSVIGVARAGFLRVD